MYFSVSFDALGGVKRTTNLLSNREEAVQLQRLGKVAARFDAGVSHFVLDCVER
jgi:hypothetical protein